MLAAILAYLDSFRPRRQPLMTRQSYAHELVTSLTFPVAMSLIEGQVVGTLAKKLFEVSYLQFATILAAPMFALVTSFIWARLARGRRKVLFIAALQTAVLAAVAVIATLPVSAFGSWALTGLVVITRCLLAGVVTLRSTVWRANYPVAVRAQVTGKLALINTVVMAIVPLLGYALLDHNPLLFRVIYPASIVIALAGVVSMTRVRLRHERDLLRFESAIGTRPQPHGPPGAPIYEYDPKNPAPNFWSVLRRDHLFRRYMFFQFLAGCSVMGSQSVVIYMIAGELTEGSKHAYAISIVLTMTVPLLLAVATMPRWARYLDRVHVATFRARQGWFWISSQLIYFAGALAWLLGASAVTVLAVFTAGQVILGVIRGGGMLAWNLGHNDFADRRMVAVYMGIHVTLTGVRGALAPFVCLALYQGWRADALRTLGVESIPVFVGIGPYVFLFTASFATAATAGFIAMKRKMARQAETQMPDAHD